MLGFRLAIITNLLLLLVTSTYGRMGFSNEVDFTIPAILSVEVPTNATYTNGAQLDFEVNFSEAVLVTGIPRIALTVGSSTLYADYVTGSGTSQLSFSYTVQSGDLDQDGIEIDALELNGGAIQDALADDNADLTLNNVEDLTGVRVDAVIPEITSVEVPEDATYGEGENLNFVINFDDVVFIFGTSPQLVLDIGGSTVMANYTGGFFDTSLSFTYTVQAGDEDLDGIEVISLDGGSITDQAGNDADRTLNNLEDPSGVLVDAVGPDVTSVNGPTDNTYIIGEVLNFSVNFDEPTIVAGSPELLFTIGSTSVAASFTGGSGSSTLSFSYTVLAGEEDTDGIVVNSLNLNGGTIEDALGNSATLTLNNIDDLSSVLVDGITPVITSVNVPADDTYGIGTDLDFRVNFSEPVNVTGSPELSIVIGSTSIDATFSGGSGTNQLDFSYTVQTENEDIDGIVVSSLNLNSSTIQDLVGNTADLTLNNIADATGVLVDGIIATVMSVAVPSDGIYGAGQVLSFDVEFSEVVEVTGTPQLSITIGSSMVNADYVSGSNSTILTFSYTVQIGNSDSDGIDVNSLGLNGGTINDLGENNADLTLNNIADPSGVLVDGVTPVVNSVNVPTDATYAEGQTMDFQVNFNEPVNVTGSPELSFIIGTTTVQAAFASGSGTSSLTFSYTVQTGEQDLDGITVSSLGLNGGDIEDIAGTDADLTLNNIENTTNVLVDAIPPVIVAVDAPADDTYAIGEILSFEVSFDKTVDVSGTPLLLFNIGTDIVAAMNISGTGSQDLVFSYMVQAADEDTDGISITVLGLNGGSIQDQLGNNADLTLNNVANTSGVLVDGIAPNITSVSVPSDDTYMIGESLDFTVDFDDVVNVTGSPELSIVIGSTTVNASFNGGSGTNQLDFSYIVQTGDEDIDGITVSSLNLNGGTIEDLVGNTADLTLNNIEDASDVLVDGINPEINISSSSSSPTMNNPIQIQISFTESVSDFTSGDMVISGGSSNNFTGSGDSYTFDLIPDADGVITIDIGANIAFDAAGNGNLESDQFQIESDQTAPTGYSLSMDLDGEALINTVNQSSIAFSITGGEVNATLNYEFRDVDGTTISGTESVSSVNQAFDNSEARYDLSGLADGDITLTISLTDPAGNMGSDVNTIEQKDVTPPDGYSITWDDYLIGMAEATSTTFTINDAEENATLEYTISSSGGGSVGPFTIVMDASTAQTITVDVSSLADGVLIVQGQLTDSDNNTGTTVSDDGTLLDQTAPDFNSVIDGGDGNYRAGETIALIADLGESGLTITGDISVYDNSFGTTVAFIDQTDDTYVLTTNELDLTDGMAEGESIAITLSASDEAGNNSTDNTLTLLLDKTPPNGYSVTFEELLFNLSNQDNASFTLSGGEIGSIYQYEITSSVGTGLVSGSGSVTNTPQEIEGISLSSLEDGDLLLSVTLTDIAGNVGDVSTFTESEKNTSPPFITPSQEFGIDENAPDGTFVGQVEASDPSSLPLSDWIIVAGDENNVFTIDTSTGELSIADNSSLDFESITSFSLSITVSNGFATSEQEMVNITVNDLNDNIPIVTPAQTFSIDENSTIGSTIGTVLATDEDAGTTFSNWTIESASPDGIVSINPNTGELAVSDNALLDYESVQSINLIIIVSDGLNVSANESVSVSINNINDNVPVISPNQVLAIPTPFVVGTSLGFIEATDADENTTFTDWTITSGNENNLFSLGSSSGEITLNSTTGFDQLSYELEMVVSDGTNISAPEIITLTIGDVTPPEVVLSSSVGIATNESLQTITATFSEEVIGFLPEDISVSNGIISNLSSTDGIVYTFDVTIIDEGDVELSVEAGVVTDFVSNPNLASNTISFTYDITDPVATITSSSSSVTRDLESTINISFSESINGFSINSLSGTNIFFENLEGSEDSFQIEGTSQEGSVEITLASGTVTDLAGNSNDEATITWRIDITPPSSYQVNILNEAINTLNQDNLRFEILNGEEDATYTYSIIRLDSVVGSGAITNAESMTVEGIDVSNLEDGILDLSVSLIDQVGNSGTPETDQIIKNTEIEIPQGFNPNRERWIIPGIENYPNNKVVIFNRFGTKLWEVSGYDNLDKSWDGGSNVSGVLGSGGAPDGTYFYVLEFTDGSLPTKSGFVIIKR